MNFYYLLHAIVTIVSIYIYIKYGNLYWRMSSNDPAKGNYQMKYYFSFILFFVGNIIIGLLRAYLKFNP